MASEETLESKTTMPVGQQLKQAREKKGLSDGDIAQAQHLRPAIIQAIEACDYQQVASELFLKGYVRAYAKQVGLDDNALVADLDRELEPLRQQREEEVQANPLVDIERRRRRKRRIAKVVLLLAVVALAAYLAYAFLLSSAEPPTRTGAAESLQSEPAAQAPTVSDSTAAATSEAIPVEPESEEEAADVAESPAEDSEPEILEEPAAGGSDGAIAATVGSAETAETLPSASAESEPVSSMAVVEPEVPETPAAPVAASDAGRLQIRFEADCWVQVSDAAGNRLVNSLQRDGDQVDVTGEAPLRVVIGAVDAVASIQFGGQPVNMSEYRVVNNRTEFTLAN